LALTVCTVESVVALNCAKPLESGSDVAGVVAFEVSDQLSTDCQSLAVPPKLSQYQVVWAEAVDAITVAHQITDRTFRVPLMMQLSCAVALKTGSHAPPQSLPRHPGE